LLVAPFALAVSGTNHIPLFYFTVLAVVRWFEWGILQYSFPSSPVGGASFFTAGSGRWRLWRLVGILVSYLADAPFLVVGGFRRTKNIMPDMRN
jgi:hypothetical protein